MPDVSPSPARWSERYPIARLGLIGDLAAAGTATVTAYAIRHAIDHHLPPGFPFLTFFPMVILLSFVCGIRAGVLTAVFSGLTAWYAFVPPTHSWVLNSAAQVAMMFYVFITATEITLIHWTQYSSRALVAQREATERLAETRELLFRELQHRVSNNLQMIAALLTVQRRRITDEGAKAALDEASRRLQTIGKISRQIYDPSGSGQALDSFLDQLARDVIETSTDRAIGHTISGTTTAGLSPEAAIPLALVVAESIANAIEHGFAAEQRDCMLQIRLRPLPDERLAVEIEDNGRGLPEGFSLTGSDSLGLRIATMLAGQLGGKYTLEPASPRGALARIELPLAA